MGPGWGAVRRPAAGQLHSQPSLVAAMLGWLELTGGSGSWRSGGHRRPRRLLAELGGEQRLVITVEVAQDVVAQTRRLLAGYRGIRLLGCDGFDGVPERAPVDRILATVGWVAGWRAGRVHGCARPAPR